MSTIKRKRIKASIGDRIFSGVIHIALILFAIAALYPFLHVIAVSLSRSEYVSSGLVSIFPKGFNLSAYAEVMRNKMIFTGYINSIYITVMTTALGVICTAMMAYPLSREELPGRKFFLIFVSITILFQAGMIPRFLVMKELGLLNSLNGVVLAGLTSGYNVTVMRNFFMNIPKSLEESAALDGCNEMQILFKIIIPLSKSILSTVAMWTMVACWNAFFDPMLYLNDIDKYTLQIFLRDIVKKASSSSNDIETGIVAVDSVRYATVMVATIPVLLIYPFIQKYFVKGTTAGAVKG